MKGIIFTEFAELVRQKFGLEMLDQIVGDIDSATNGAYTSVGTYADQEMYDLALALSARSGIELGDLLQEFGKHLFGQLAKLYPTQIEHAKSTFDVLTSLETIIHPNVKKLYPDAMLPSFSSELLDSETLSLRYESSRGLPDLAIGLITGCGLWFNEAINVETVSSESDGKRVHFVIRRVK